MKEILHVAMGDSRSRHRLRQSTCRSKSKRPARRSSLRRKPESSVVVKMDSRASGNDGTDCPEFPLLNALPIVWLDEFSGLVVMLHYVTGGAFLSNGCG